MAKTQRNSTANVSVVRSSPLVPSRDWWATGLTLAAVIISLILGCFNLWSTSRQLQYSRAQIDQTRQQLVQAKHAEVTEQRPWVEVHSAAIVTDPKTHLAGMTIQAKNLGKTPALNVKIEFMGSKARPMFDSVHISRNEVIGLSASQTATILAPGEQNNIMDLSMNSDNGNGKLRERLQHYLAEYAKGYLRMDGAIAYTDLNGTEGLTQFCFILLDGQSNNRCPGNTMQ